MGHLLSWKPTLQLQSKRDELATRAYHKLSNCPHLPLVPLCRLMDLAKEMTKEALPIKCLEAVILGMYPFLLQVHV